MELKKAEQEKQIEAKKIKKLKILKLKGAPVAISLLIAITRISFVNIKRWFLSTFELANHDILTYHYIAKHQPNFESGILDITKKYALLIRETRIKKNKINKESETKKNKILKYFYSKVK